MLHLPERSRAGELAVSSSVMHPRRLDSSIYPSQSYLICWFMLFWSILIFQEANKWTNRGGTHRKCSKEARCDLRKCDPKCSPYRQYWNWRRARLVTRSLSVRSNPSHTCELLEAKETAPKRARTRSIPSESGMNYLQKVALRREFSANSAS